MIIAGRNRCRSYGVCTTIAGRRASSAGASTSAASAPPSASGTRTVRRTSAGAGAAAPGAASDRRGGVLRGAGPRVDGPEAAREEEDQEPGEAGGARGTAGSGHPLRTAPGSRRLRSAGSAAPVHCRAMVYVWFLVVAEALGIATAIAALFRVRTSQGAIAWVVCAGDAAVPGGAGVLGLRTAPVPGLRRWRGGGTCRRWRGRRRRSRRGTPRSGLVDPPQDPADRLLVRLARLPFTRGNDAELLVDGEATFRSMLRGHRARGALRAGAVLHPARRRARPRRSRSASWRRPARGCASTCSSTRSAAACRGRISESWSSAGAVVRPFNTRRGRGEPLPAQLPQPPQDRRRGRPRGVGRAATTSATSTSGATRDRPLARHARPRARARGACVQLAFARGLALGGGRRPRPRVGAAAARRRPGAAHPRPPHRPRRPLRDLRALLHST